MNFTIDDILEITNKIVNVDGEELYIIENGMITELDKLKNRIKDEKTDPLILMLNKDVKFVCSHSKFAIAFRSIRWGYEKKWIPCLLYKFEDEWRRVIIQYADCRICGWSGIIANPTNPDLYITMVNRFDILKKMWQLHFLKCPKCGSDISSQAIWIKDSI